MHQYIEDRQDSVETSTCLPAGRGHAAADNSGDFPFGI